MGRLVQVGPVKLCSSKVDMETANAVVFGEQVLRRVHGDGLRIEPWNEAGVRTLKICVERPEITPDAGAAGPSGLAGLMGNACAKTVKTTVTQQIHRDTDATQVSSKVRLKMLGAEFIKIRPLFEIYRDATEDGMMFKATVELQAVIPPPMCHLVEGFMEAQTLESLNEYVTAISDLLAK